VSLENPLSDWLVSWILGFGAGVEVQAPSELRQKVAERAHAIAALHT
jgi:predicted DNA-binding transcriptional regulator YafY